MLLVRRNKENPHSGWSGRIVPAAVKLSAKARLAERLALIAFRVLVLVSALRWSFFPVAWRGQRRL
jgi:hypothetical protein